MLELVRGMLEIVIELIESLPLLRHASGIVHKISEGMRVHPLRRVWGIKDGEEVTIICSELEDPLERQRVEPREFIYLLKYGDLDAFIETVITLLRLYPSVKLRISSAGEVIGAQNNLGTHLVVIGGPDYNRVANHIINEINYQDQANQPQFTYINRHEQIALYHRITGNEYYWMQDERGADGDTEYDYGYFERIPNPYNRSKWTILIGGCHTIGVTGAVKAFSFPFDENRLPQRVAKNASLVSKKIRKAKSFAVLVQVQRVGQIIFAPEIIDGNVFVRE